MLLEFRKRGTKRIMSVQIEDTYLEQILNVGDISVFAMNCLGRLKSVDNKHFTTASTRGSNSDAKFESKERYETLIKLVCGLLSSLFDTW